MVLCDLLDQIATVTAIFVPKFLVVVLLMHVLVWSTNDLFQLKSLLLLCDYHFTILLL